MHAVRGGTMSVQRQLNELIGRAELVVLEEEDRTIERISLINSNWKGDLFQFTISFVFPNL